MSISLIHKTNNFERFSVARRNYAEAKRLLEGIVKASAANEPRVLRALALLESALESGSGDAGYCLASFYRRGKFVKKSEALARSFVRKAATAALPSAAALRVEGVWRLKANMIDEAERLLRKSAELGSRDAAADLAMIAKSRAEGCGSIAALTTLVTYEGEETSRSRGMMERLKQELPDGYKSKLH